MGRLGLCCRSVGLIVWTIIWFLIRALILPVAILGVLLIAGPVGFLEWLILGSRHVWNLWLCFNDAAGSLIPEL